MKSSATLALARGYRVPVGVANVEGKKVIEWVEKPLLNLYVGIGILILDAKILTQLPLLSEKKKELDITKDLIPYLVEKGYPVNAYLTDSYWYDVGSIEKYEKLNNSELEKYFNFLFPSL
jgi:mannose-1-phosphate guanylyltransferase